MELETNNLVQKNQKTSESNHGKEKEKQQYKQHSTFRLLAAEQPKENNLLKQRGTTLIENRVLRVTPVRIEFNVEKERTEFNIRKETETLLKKCGKQTQA